MKRSQILSAAEIRRRILERLGARSVPTSDVVQSVPAPRNVVWSEIALMCLDGVTTTDSANIADYHGPVLLRALAAPEATP